MDYKDLAILADNLAVGVLLLLSIAYAIWLIGSREHRFWSWVQQPFKEQPSVLSIALLLLTYGVGHIVVDLSEAAYTNHVHPLVWFANKDELRAGALKYKNHELAREILGRHEAMRELLDDLPETDLQEARLAVKQRSFDALPDNHAFIHRLFYDAKNWCYASDHAAELGRAEQWMILTRALAAVSLVSPLLFALLVLVGRALGWSRRSGSVSFGVCSGSQSTTRAEASIWASFVCLHLGLVALAALGHGAQSSWYNRRIFGYWASHLPRGSTRVPATVDSAAAARLGESEALRLAHLAARYSAQAEQAFVAARAALASVSQQRAQSRLAIVFDVDATLNSLAAHRAALPGLSSRLADALAGPRGIPGAAEFSRDASARGVTAFYVSNRSALAEAETRDQLSNLGFSVPTLDSILSPGERPEWGVDKVTRQRFIANDYDVLLWLGDDITRFQEAPIQAGSVAEWGTSRVLIPTPMFDAWFENAPGRSGWLEAAR